MKKIANNLQKHLIEPIPEEDGFYVYILLCENNTLYCGWTTNLKRRYLAHTTGKGAKYTRMHKPIGLYYYESYSSAKSAQKREYAIKQMTRQKKEQVACYNKNIINNLKEKHMKTLFEPWNLKHLTLKNRICIPPMVCYGFSDNESYVSQRNLDHYSAIAKGGAGLIIVEATCINREGRLSDTQLGIWDDSHIEGLAKIADVIHKENIPAFIQIHHAGGVGISGTLMSSSNYTCEKRGRILEAHEMTLEQIKEVQKQYVEACIRAYKAGFDGVELHGCHSYLMSQFLCTKVNKRKDEYGKDPLKFVMEIFKEVKVNVPSDFIVGIRLGGFEPTLENSISYAKRLEEAGIDFIDVSYGFSLEHEPYTPENYPFKDVIFAADTISKEVKVPVFAVNGIITKKQAEDVIEKTGAAMVDIGRGVLVNYNWVNDIKENKETGKCFNCPRCLWNVDATKCPGRKLFNETH